MDYQSKGVPGLSAGGVHTQRGQKVTIRTVAESAGVSIATVSRALSGSRVVSPEIRKAVEAAAEDLGYSRNTLAVALRSSRTNTVGMVVPGICHPLASHLIQEVEGALHGRGVHLLLCNSHQDPDREEAVVRSLIQKQVDGLIICPVDVETSRSSVERASRYIPIVQIAQRVELANVDWVGANDVTAMKLIVQHLRSAGVKSAGYAGADGRDTSSNERHRAFLQHACSAGIAVDPENVFLGRNSEEWGRASMRSLLDGTTLPDALVCASNAIAAGALQECAGEKNAIPENLTITGFDDIAFPNISTQLLTTVSPQSKTWPNTQSISCSLHWPEPNEHPCGSPFPLPSPSGRAVSP